MASNTEIATSKVILDGQQAENELKRLAVLASDLKKKMRLAVQSGDEAGAKKLKKELSDVEQQAAAAKREMNSIGAVMKNLNGSSLKQLSQAQRQLSADIRNSTRNTKEEIEAIKLKQKQLRLLKAEIDKVQSAMSYQSGGTMGKLANGFNKYFAMISGGILAITGVAFSLKQMISGNAELADSMADVAKTSGLTTKEVKSLYRELGKIDTRTPRKELLDLAYAAGKLGYSGEAEILGFVKAADKIGVALSKDLGTNVEEAVTSLGKLADIFKIKDEFGIEQALLKTGSAINALGASGTANEAYIVDFTKRLGGIAPQAGLSIEQIMGLGATLDQLGQQVETSSTAVTQLITKMFSKPGEYAKIAGLSVAEFTKLIKTDANTALIKLLEGLNKNKGGLTELAAKFGDLGVDGSRAISVIGALSNNVEMLKDAQALSNTEFKKGSSLTNEFNLKNENLAGNMERIGKALRSAFVNSAVNEGLSGIVAKIAEWTKIPLSETLEEERIKVNVLTNRLMEANISLAERKKIVTELKTLAPDVVKGINAEAIAYNTLRSNLAEYNKEAMNRVIIQRSQEDIDKKNTDLLKLASERLAKEDVLRRQLLKLAEDSAEKLGTKVGAQIFEVIRSGEDLIVQAQKVKKIINDNQSGALGAKVEGVLNMSGIMNKILVLEQKEAVITGEVNKKFTERDKLMKEFGITVTGTTAVTEEYIETTDTDTESTNDNTEAKKALSDALKELQDKITKLDSQINDAIANGDTPLARKLFLEAKAAKDLLLVYEELKIQIGKGWLIPDLNSETANTPFIENLVSVGAKLASPQKNNITGKTPLQKLGDRLRNVITDEPNALKKRDSGIGPATPEEAAQFERDRVAAEENAAADSRQAIKDAAFAGAESLNNGIFEITANRQKAEFDHKISLLEKERDIELSNKKLTEAQKDAINAKYDAKARKLKQEAFKKQQNADKIQALINGAIAITKTFAAYGFTPAGWAAAAAQAISTAMEYAVIDSQPVPEYAKGRYTVTGAGTGKRYENVSYTGPAVTGLYTKPAIVAESGAEMIIDAPTTRNLMVNYPEIIEAINNARMPEFASGRYIVPVEQVPGASNTNGRMSAEEIRAMNRHSEAMELMVKNGVRGNWSLFDLEKIQKAKSNIQSATDL